MMLLFHHDDEHDGRCEFVHISYKTKNNNCLDTLTHSQYCSSVLDIVRSFVSCCVHLNR